MNNRVAAQTDESIKISDTSSEVVKAMEELVSSLFIFYVTETKRFAFLFANFYFLCWPDLFWLMLKVS